MDLACTNQTAEFSIVIQHIKRAKRLNDCLMDNQPQYNTEKIHFYEVELIFILFQIYYTLSELRDSFTHYDLHLENVLLYEPVKKSYIQYIYNVNGTEIRFKSKYIVKIIDYGRCFFKNENMSSDDIRDYICNIPGCNSGNQVCGNQLGFNSITDNANFCIEHHICSNRKNISHDLRLLHLLNNVFNDVNNHVAFDVFIIRNIIEKVVFTGQYGTPELTNSGLPQNIHNVTDAFTAILESIQTATDLNELNNKYYENHTSLGNLHVYGGNKNSHFDKVK